MSPNFSGNPVSPPGSQDDLWVPSTESGFTWTSTQSRDRCADSRLKESRVETETTSYTQPPKTKRLKNSSQTYSHPKDKTRDKTKENE